MIEAKLVDMIPGPVALPAPAEGSTYVVYEVRGTSAELDGAIRVVPTLLTAVGTGRISVSDAERIGRITAGVVSILSDGLQLADGWRAAQLVMAEVGR